MPFPSEIPVETYSGVNLNLWIISIVLHLICALIIGIKAQKVKEVPSLHSLLFGYAFFNFTMAFNRIFFLWAYLSSGWSQYYRYLSIGYIFCSVAYTPVIFILEKYLVKKTHYVFSLFASLIFILSIISAFLPENMQTFRSAMQLLGFGSSLLWFVLYFYLIKQSTGAPKKKAILIVFSVIIAALGFTMDSEMIISTHLLPLYIAPLLYIIGVVILAIVLWKD